MRVFFTLNQNSAVQIAQTLNLELARSAAMADRVVLFPGHTEQVDYPDKTIVIAGMYTPESYDYANSLLAKGVAANRIVFTPERNIGINELQTLLKSSHEGLPQVIGIVSVKGGVGKTTIATSLVAHYNTFSQKAVCIDACTPRNAHYHLGENEIEEGLGNLDELKQKCQRIIVDLPHNYDDYSSFDRVVTVVDPDLIQCIKPSQNNLCDVVVYNRAREDVPLELVEQVFQCPVIKIAEDYRGCAAALTSGQVASLKSEIITIGIGQLAAEIEKVKH